MNHRETKFPSPVAVIDVGSHSARLEIVQFRDDASFQMLEELSLPVPLGRDVFMKGAIQPENINTIGKILNDFRKEMSEYGVQFHKAIATSAVREASNRDIFLDRVRNLSGIELEVLEGPEEIRLIFLSVKKLLAGKFSLAGKNAVMCTIGTGSTHTAFIQDGRLISAESYRMGTLRLYEEIGGTVSSTKSGSIIEIFVASTVEQIEKGYPEGQRPELFIAVGAPLRSIVNLGKTETRQKIALLSKRKLMAVASKISGAPPDKLAGEYGISDLVAQSLEPCCDILERFFEITSADRIIVPMLSTRDAIIDDMIRGFTGEKDGFPEEIVSAAKFLGQKFKYDSEHALCAALNSMAIFDSLKTVHGMDGRARLLLEVAAILHDIGQFVNSRQHHKHSCYLIRNSQLPGISPDELNIIAAVARYHRRGGPKLSHPEFTCLLPEQRVLVMKLAGILRIADALDRSRLHQIRNISVSYDDENLYVKTNASYDLAIEKLEVKKKKDIFTGVFGLKVVVE